jgi:hypothetical protein
MLIIWFNYIKTSVFLDKNKKRKKEKKEENTRQNSHNSLIKVTFLLIFEMCVCKTRFKNTQS